MEKAVLMNSGGIDTLATCVKLRELFSDLTLFSVTVDYGQLGIEAAKTSAAIIAEEFCISHEVVQIPGDWRCADENGELTKLPFRMTVYHLIAAMKARKYDAPYIASGLDNVFSENFGKRFCALITEESKASSYPIAIHPIRTLNRAERFALALQSQSVSKTHSCEYEVPCGGCTKCLERIQYGIV